MERLSDSVLRRHGGMMEPYPLFDPSGKARAWLDAGRGIAVWPCLALDSVQLGTDILKPGDDAGAPSDWRYRASAPARVLGLGDVIEYRPVYSIREWSDTPQGRRAARAWLDRWNADPANVERTAPVGRVLSRVMLEQFQLGCVAYEEVPGQQERRLVLDKYQHVTRFVIAAVLWSAIIPAEEKAS